MSRIALVLLALALSFAPAHGQGRGKPNDTELTRANPRFVAAFKDCVATASRSTVRILCEGKDTALGMVVSEDGWILTKANDLKSDVSVRLPDGVERPAQIVGVHVPHDLAMLKIDAKGLEPIRFEDSKGIDAGGWVACAGAGEEAVAIGVISVPTRSVRTRGPIIDPAKTPYLGVSLGPTDRLDGVKVLEVVPQTPAAKIGIQKDDVIVRIGGESVTSPETFMEAISKSKPGDSVVLRLRRGEMELDKTATLERRPIGSFRGEMQNRMGSELSSRRTGYGTILQHDSVVKPTDCGGPLVDLDGHVLGINICRAGRTESWAVPSEVIRPLLEELKSGKWAPAEARTQIRKNLEEQVANLKAFITGSVKVGRGEREEARRSLDAAEKELRTIRIQDAKESSNGLLDLMRRRLLMMNDVAAWKWNHRVEIRDRDREEASLARLVAGAKERGIDPAVANHFFEAQFAAARLVQEDRVALWQRSNLMAPPRGDLERDLRPRIDRLNEEILDAFAQVVKNGIDTLPPVREHARQRATQTLAGFGISDAVRAKALEGFGGADRN